VLVFGLAIGLIAEPASCSGQYGRHRRLHCAGRLIVIAIVAVGGITFSL
jgi:hypothetical protein